MGRIFFSKLALGAQPGHSGNEKTINMLLREPFSIEWSKPECALFGELMISALDQEMFAHKKNVNTNQVKFKYTGKDQTNYWSQTNRGTRSDIMGE